MVLKLFTSRTQCLEWQSVWDTPEVTAWHFMCIECTKQDCECSTWNRALLHCSKWTSTKAWSFRNQVDSLQSLTVYEVHALGTMFGTKAYLFLSILKFPICNCSIWDRVPMNSVSKIGNRSIKVAANQCNRYVYWGARQHQTISSSFVCFFCTIPEKLLSVWHRLLDKIHTTVLLVLVMNGLTMHFHSCPYSWWSWRCSWINVEREENILC